MSNQTFIETQDINTYNDICYMCNLTADEKSELMEFIEIHGKNIGKYYKYEHALLTSNRPHKILVYLSYSVLNDITSMSVALSDEGTYTTDNTYITGAYHEVIGNAIGYALHENKLFDVAVFKYHDHPIIGKYIQDYTTSKTVGKLTLPKLGINELTELCDVLGYDVNFETTPTKGMRVFDNYIVRGGIGGVRDMNDYRPNEVITKISITSKK